MRQYLLLNDNYMNRLSQQER